MSVTDWDKLRIFYQVAKLKSFTKASKVMFISQSALSRQILNLEDRLKIQVFNRLPEGLELTKEGQFLFEQVEKMWAHAEAADRYLRDKELEAEGSIILKSSNTLISWITPHLSAFLELNPKINFKLIADTKTSNDPNVDAYISTYLENRKDLNQIFIHKLSTGVYASKEYLKKFGEPKKVQDLDSHKIIINNSSVIGYGGSDWLLSAGREESPRIPHITFETSSHSIIKAVQSGLGIAHFPKGFPETEDANLVQILEDIEMPTVNIYYVYPKDKERYKSLKTFGKFLAQTDLSYKV